MMNRTMRRGARRLLALAVIAASAAQAEADPLTDALMKSKVSGNFRVRQESVDLDSATVDDASALTLRSRLGIETAPQKGLTAILEFEDTRALFGQDEYAPETAGYAVVVDPENTEVNRAYLRYRGISRLDMGLGRQRLVLDNQRFVGNVGWRQDEQTFDAFSASYTGVPDWSLFYAYVDHVNGIADVEPAFNFDIDSSDHLLNAAWTGLKFGKLSAYGYALENEEPDAALRNLPPRVNALNLTLRYRENATAGLRFDGNYTLPLTLPVRLLYTAEYAIQELENATGLDFDTDYSLIDAGAGYVTGIGVVSARLARETLGSDRAGNAMQGFQTPYATKHAFNGWVDMFLNTPAGGLVDTYLTLAADLTPYGIKLMAVYHEYAEDDGPLRGGAPRDFGSEWNLQGTRQFGAHYTVGLKYGNYEADGDVPVLIGTTANVDTEKFWLWAEYNF
jgi:hypothetical protein